MPKLINHPGVVDRDLANVPTWSHVFVAEFERKYQAWCRRRGLSYDGRDFVFGRGMNKPKTKDKNHDQ